MVDSETKREALQRLQAEAAARMMNVMGEDDDAGAWANAAAMAAAVCRLSCGRGVCSVMGCITSPSAHLTCARSRHALPATHPGADSLQGGAQAQGLLTHPPTHTHAPTQSLRCPPPPRRCR